MTDERIGQLTGLIYYASKQHGKNARLIWQAMEPHLRDDNEAEAVRSTVTTLYGCIPAKLQQTAVL